MAKLCTYYLAKREITDTKGFLDFLTKSLIKNEVLSQVFQEGQKSLKRSLDYMVKHRSASGGCLGS